MGVFASPVRSYPPGFRTRRGLNWGALGVLYASYYMARYNFRFATPGMTEEFHFDVAAITQIWVVWSLAYGTGQLVNGLLADRIGGKTSMLMGAAGTIVCNLIFGFSSFVGTLATFGLIAILNGWFQSCGAPGMIKINAAWFARQERGTFAGIFGIMIQMGQYAINTLAPFLLAGFTVSLWFIGTWMVEPGSWRVLFIIPPFVTAAAAVWMALTAKEEPAAAGFPRVIHDELDDTAGTRVSLKESFTTIFTHPLVWFYAAAYACTGAVRHSSDQLSVLFFTQHLGLDMKAKPLAVLVILNLMTTSAILGSVLSGWVSDRFFGGHRSPVARFLYLLEASVIAVAALMMFSGLIKPGLFGVTLAGIFLVLVSLTVNSTHSVVGAAAPMDIGGKKMAGFAAGVIDSFQYYGSAICLFASGLLIKKFGWGAWYPIMVLFALGGALAMHHVRKLQLHHKNSPDGDPRIKNS